MLGRVRVRSSTFAMPERPKTVTPKNVQKEGMVLSPLEKSIQRITVTGRTIKPVARVSSAAPYCARVPDNAL